ncbi:MAG: malonate-semialdehyde dehydrogenase (acetylating)/methylmalonate-semialdehyde dehydrogenase [Rhodothermales bacterium]|jgi:malonate-semialdehyde dehydrogenase (acetylating)/methylmalonate-semialdehyde dehydrogenase
MSTLVEQSVLSNYIGGRMRESVSRRHLPVTAPGTGEVITEVPMSTVADLDTAVQAATAAQKDWAAMPMKDRVQVLYRFKALIERDEDRLCEVVTLENGKTIPESRGSVLRAVECVEFACSLPQIAPGLVMEVSRGVQCRTSREPLGVVAGITPFNFPFMVPLWMVPMAIALGNAFVLKPSEQTPLSAMELARLLEEAGLPAGIFSVVHGDREIVEGMCDHPGIGAIGFVGSTKVAKLVYERGAKHGKRVRAMGGAKNHLIVVPDADPDMTAANVTASVTGCAGQRCMAASVLVAVGDCQHIIDRIKEEMGAMEGGRDIGAIISEVAFDRITGYLERAESGGAQLILDGRNRVSHDAPTRGRYLGASIIDHAQPDHEASCTEIFGPTLTIIRCNTLDEAIAIENANPYGNAAAIYTSSGGTAQHFADHASAGMIGINIGVPVPREPFAFGGWNDSAFGGGDITGPTAIDFWTRMKKVTTKWNPSGSANWMS